MDDFDKMFKHGTTFIIVVWVMVIVFLLMCIIAGIMGLVWLGHHI